MLTITQRQFDALALQRQRRFERRLAASLRQTLPGLDAEALEIRVREVVLRALRLFVSERDVARFTALVLRHFGGWPAAGLPEDALNLLQGEALPAQRRLDNFERWARQRELHQGD
jgi:hypothetical protein